MEQRMVLGEDGLFFSSEGWCPLDDGDGDPFLLETSLGGSQRDLCEIYSTGERRVEWREDVFLYPSGPRCPHMEMEGGVVTNIDEDFCFCSLCGKVVRREDS